MKTGIIIETPDRFVLEFPYRPKTIAAVQRIPGRAYDREQKTWSVPKSSKQELDRFAATHGFTYGGPKDTRPEEYGVIPELPELTIDIPLKWTMYPYQKTGVAYNLIRKRTIIGDQMGLGKTLQAIATIIGADVKGDIVFPCLVICPSSLKDNWKFEWESATDRKAIILNDAVKTNFIRYHEAGLADVFITNFESLKKFFVMKIDTPPKGAPLRLNHIHFNPNIGHFKSIIIDEVHKCRSMSAQQTKFTKGICIGKEYILALTGTPYVNSPRDLISQLGIIDQFQLFGGYKNFVERYCSGKNEASNLKELNYKLNINCFYRRDKEKVLTDLPPKTRTVIYCELDRKSRKEYSEAEASLASYLKAYKEATDKEIARAMRGEVMVRIGILKNISARGKMKDVKEFIDDVMEQGEKLIMFGYLRDTMNKFEELYPEAVFITGAESNEKKEKAKDDFQKCKTCGVRFERHGDDHAFVPSDTKLIVLNYKSGGVGHTLTAASRVGFIEIPWTAADCDQCEDRAHRNSQKENVTCYYFLGKDTIDEWLYGIVKAKREAADTTTGNETVVEEEIIDKLFNLFNQPK